MSTSILINPHTPGPLSEDGLFAYANQVIVASPHLDLDLIPLAQREANARLLVVAYNAFDKVAREMGVDAVELAEKFPIEDAIEVWANAHVPNMPRKEFLHGWFGISKHIVTHP